MILIDFNYNITNESEILIKYRNFNEDVWYNMLIDIKTLSVLINNFGIACVNYLYNLYNKEINLDIGRNLDNCDVNYCGYKLTLYLRNYNHKKYIESVKEMTKNY
jgi:hypothetical protein